MSNFLKSELRNWTNEPDENFKFSEKLVETKVVKNDSSYSMFTLGREDTTSFDDMPTKEEYDLEEQLKAGFKPEQINVRGVLPDSNGEYNAIRAFNSLQSQIDSITKKSDVVDNVESKE